MRGWFKVFKTNHRSIVEKPNHFLIYFGHSIKHFYFIYTVEETLMLDPKKYSQTSISRTTITWIFQIFRLAYLVPLCLNIYIHILIIWTLDYPNFLSPVPTSPHNWGSTVIISLFSLHACWIMYICSLEKLLTNQLLAVTGLRRFRTMCTVDM